MIIVIIWAVLFFALLVATIVCGVYCLRCNEQARPRAIDTLLLLATLLVAVNLGAAFLPKTAEMQKAAEVSELNYIHKSDLLAAGLTTSSYVDRIGDPWFQLAHIQGASDLQEALQRTKKGLESLLEKHPSDPGLLGRLAIVVHESGGDADAVLSDPELIDRDESIRAIKDIYSKSDTISDDELSRIQHLPDNWYRDSLLLSAYKKISSQKYDELKSQIDSRFQAWKQRYIAIESITLLAMALSIPSFIILRKRFRKDVPAPVTYGFRKTYGCILFVLYMQSVVVMFAGMAIGFSAGFAAAQHHTKIEFTDSAIPLLIVAYLSVAAGAWISTKYFVCRPAGVGFQKAFWTDDLKMKQVLSFALAGLCISIALIFLVHIAVVAIPHVNHGTVNPFTIQLADSLLSGNPIMLIFCVIAMCLIAPIVEEILFRGLLYPWLRNRWGVVAGIIISALIFAAWHFDPGQFPMLTVNGLVFAAVFECTRSLRVTTFIHAFWNTWVLVVATNLLPK